MTVHYFDPSAWIKRFFRESGSDTINALFRSTPAAACSRLGLLEVTATITRTCHGAGGRPSDGPVDSGQRSG